MLILIKIFTKIIILYNSKNNNNYDNKSIIYLITILYLDNTVMKRKLTEPSYCFSCILTLVFESFSVPHIYLDIL